MTSEHAGIPRWSDEPPGVDGSGARFGIVGDDSDVTRLWAKQISVLERPCWRARADELDGFLRGATVGLRVAVTGPEDEVLAVAARCRAAGLNEAELTLHATSAARRGVYCPHCTATTTVEAQVDDVAPCGGCGRDLLIFGHLAARTGTYLGFQADAEEMA